MKKIISNLKSKLQKTMNRNKFYANEVNDFNKSLDVISKSLNNEFYDDNLISELAGSIQNCGLPITELKIKAGGIPNIKGVSKELLAPFQKSIKAVKIQKVKIVKQQKYETAAGLRDSEKNLHIAVYDLVLRELSLVEGFNYWNGSLLIVTPKSTEMETLMTKVMERVSLKIR